MIAVENYPQAEVCYYEENSKYKYAFKSYALDENFKYIDYEKISREINYQINGFHYTLPIELKPIFLLLKRHENILTLVENWDNEGSEGYSVDTWISAAKFILDYSCNIYNEFDYIIDIPKIYPSANGSLDIDWETETYGLLINIPKEGLNATYYGDNKGSQMTEGIFNPLDFNINLLPKAISF